MSPLKRIFYKILPILACVVMIAMPGAARADMAIIDAFNLAPFVPIVLDALMAIATGGYNFFVGNGDGIIYIFVWGFLALTMVLYLLKMFFPKVWLSVFGFSGGGTVDNPEKVATNLARPAVRAIIAVTIMLQLTPSFMTRWLINPFLQFGATYTHAITETISSTMGVTSPKIPCPQDIVNNGWITAESCEFLVQPVSDISHANNQIIKRGFEFITRGIAGLMTLIPHGGENFLNVITGLIMVATFAASNIFMALLIIQAIFDFGMALILYPFQVLTYVVKSSDEWLDIWPAFSGITKTLQRLLITMIACAFILCINLAVIKSLFGWQTSVFVVAAGGTSVTNVPATANATMGFGSHAMMWLSAILTFYLMFKIFELTRKQLKSFAGDGSDKLYTQVVGDTKQFAGNVKSLGKAIGTAAGWIKKK